MASADHRIATVTAVDSATAQTLFAGAIAQWRSAGLKVAAVLAETLTPTEAVCSADFLRDVTSGIAYSIHLEEPPRDTTCHLDASGVDAACAALLPQLAACDLVVLSKFGKLESMGRGLFPAFEAARAAGLPVLTTVSAKHEDAWHRFAPDAVALPAEVGALQGWWRSLAHSHSIVLSHGNALNFQRKFFLCAMKNRLPGPSEICALDFKHKFGRSAVCSVSRTIANDRSIF